MRFYAPAQIVHHAREHDVEVRPVSVIGPGGIARWSPSTARTGTPSGLACEWCAGLRPPMPPGSWLLARINTLKASTTCGGVRVPAASLVELAEADAFLPSVRLPGRDALWAIKVLRGEPLPLFAAGAERETRTLAEQQEPEVELRQMTAGHNVVEDYSHTGLTLREHPISFLRRDLAERRIVTSAEAMSARDGRWLMAAGLVLVRQRPGSAKGVIFITLEDETLGASMMAINGRIQREGDVVHLVAQQLLWRRPCRRSKLLY